MILKYRIPLTVAAGAGAKFDDPDTLLAIIETATSSELITATNQFSKLKAWKIPAVQEAYRQASKKAVKDKRVSTLKASKATKVVNEGTKKTVAQIKEQAADSLKEIEGDWLILADRSPSMSASIEAGKQLAGLLSHRVKGKVYLVFFDAGPTTYDVTGKTLDQIEQMTKHITTGSATSIGCGVKWLRSKKHDVDGIVLLTDGQENHPPYFVEEYKKLANEPALYWVEMYGGYETISSQLSKAGIQCTTFNVRQNFDEYAMLNVVNVLKPQVYGFLEEVMETPLLKVAQVFT